MLHTYPTHGKIGSSIVDFLSFSIHASLILLSLVPVHLHFTAFIIYRSNSGCSCGKDVCHSICISVYDEVFASSPYSEHIASIGRRALNMSAYPFWLCSSGDSHWILLCLCRTLWFCQYLPYISGRGCVISSVTVLGQFLFVL